MNEIPLIYITPHQSQGSHGDGWLLERADGALPLVKAWLDQLPESVFETEKLVLLISDALMYPLRVTLTEKVKANELDQYLLWKLKRYIPWPTDQVELRYLPLAGEHTWLTFSLPKPWCEGIFEAFRERGVHCGYVGGAFTYLLENQQHMRNHANLCFFNDYYLFAELDGGGFYQNFRMRRLPFRDDEGLDLDVDTLYQQDLVALLTELERPLQVFNFEPRLEPLLTNLSTQQVMQDHQVKELRLLGTTLQRLQACCYSSEVWT